MAHFDGLGHRIEKNRSSQPSSCRQDLGPLSYKQDRSGPSLLIILGMRNILDNLSSMGGRYSGNTTSSIRLKLGLVASRDNVPTYGKILTNTWTRYSTAFATQSMITCKVLRGRTIPGMSRANRMPYHSCGSCEAEKYSLHNAVSNFRECRQRCRRYFKIRGTYRTSLPLCFTAEKALIDLLWLIINSPACKLRYLPACHEAGADQDAYLYRRLIQASLFPG